VQLNSRDAGSRCLGARGGTDHSGIARYGGLSRCHARTCPWRAVLVGDVALLSGRRSITEQAPCGGAVFNFAMPCMTT